MTLKSKKNNDITESNQGIHNGHRNRMRERFRSNGFNGMREHEILEMLLYYSVPRKDTNPIGHRLINRFGSLTGVLDASFDQLLLVDGITENSATLIKMMVPLFHEYQKNTLKGERFNSSEDCGSLLCDYYMGVSEEQVTVICMDASCKVLAFEPVCEGDANNVVINCRRLVEIVLKYPKISAVIIAHNHPNGLALPSRDDINSTAELVKTLKSMGINLIDHIIVAGDDFISMSSSANFRNIFKQSDFCVLVS